MISGELTPSERATLERAVSHAEEMSGLKFSAHLGSFEVSAVDLLKRLDDPTHQVLVAVDPEQKTLQIVTGAEAQRHLNDQEAALASATMRSSFAAGDIVGGVAHGIQQLGQAAHKPQTLHDHPTFTDLD